jgi:hypothetical protein
MQLYKFRHLSRWRAMNDHALLQPAARWAEQEMNDAQLGDRRRTRRLVRVAAALAENPHGTLPATFPEWRDLRAGHPRRTAAACHQPGQYLLLEDTTTLSFNSHAEAAGLGPVNDRASRGILVHNTLALRVSAWDGSHAPVTALVGLAGQHCWTRPKKGLSRKQKAREGRLRRQRESARWAACLRDWAAPAGTRWIYVADREADIYEVFGRCAEHGADWVVRAAQARALEGDDRSVLLAVAQAPVRGHLNLELRARTGQPARQARVALRALTVTLRGPWRPAGPPAPQTLQVVEVREVSPPAGQKPLVWVLLTSLPAGTWKQIKQIVGCYTQRWLVEEFHKALKSGTKMEASQLAGSRALEALCAVLSLVALRLLNTKLYARAFPDEPVSLGQFSPHLLKLLAARLGQPAGVWTQREVWRGIARWGGFLNRKGDGEPGWQTIWRGWRDLIASVNSIELLEQKKAKRCG